MDLREKVKALLAEHGIAATFEEGSLSLNILKAMEEVEKETKDKK